MIYLFFIIGRIIGLRISRKIFSYLFTLAGPHFKSKKVIKKNLEIYLNRTFDQDIKKIKNNMWKNYGMTFIEYIFLDYFKKKNNFVKIEGEENLIQIIQSKKPVIFVSGHFANFELMSMEISKKNILLATIYRPLNNIFLNPFMEYLRKNIFVKIKLRRELME